MNELYLLGGALVGAGAYIMYLHREIKLYRRDVGVLTFVLAQVEQVLKEEADGKED